MKPTISLNALINIARDGKLSAHGAMLELVDNSIDAEATKINIEMDSEKIIIHDNGRGFSKDQLINAFMNISAPPYEKDSKIGRHNTGMKTASIRLGNDLTILTKADKGFIVFLNWPKICYHNEEIKDPKEFNTSFSGTQITIDSLYKPQQRDKTDLKYHLARIYKRKIEAGLIIILNGDRIKSLPNIPLIKERFIKEGKYSIRYGLYDPVEIEKSDWHVNDVVGLHIYYRDRLFDRRTEERTANGIISNTGNYYVEINTSSSEFEPTLHKDGFRQLENILNYKNIAIINDNIRLDEKGISNEENKKISERLTEMAKKIAKKTKRDDTGNTLEEIGQGRRNPKENTGTKTISTLNGSKHKYYSKGDETSEKHIIKNKECDLSKIIIRPTESCVDKYGWAAVDRTGTATVYINYDANRFIKRLKKENDDDTLFFIAMSILAKEWVKHFSFDGMYAIEEFIYNSTKYLL